MPGPGDIAIANYMQRLQRILGDRVFKRFNPYDLLDYINEARGFVAAQGECIRILCPSTAGVSNIAVTAGGSGYTTATVTMTAPTLGRTATATATILLGAIDGFVITDPGTGYTVPPSVTITGDGTGATATATLMPFAQCVAGQEVYQHEDFSPIILSSGTGAERIIAIQSIAISWGSMKPTLRNLAWGDFQAYLRAYNVGVQGYSRVWSQYKRGTSGNFYLWPVPSQNSQMDLDCICTPQNLQLDSNAGMEPIPYPYTNAVPYKAAEIAVLGEPDLRDLSDRYLKHYDNRMAFAAVTSSPTLVPDYYSPWSGA